jgi:hypothetical protein
VPTDIDKAPEILETTGGAVVVVDIGNVVVPHGGHIVVVTALAAYTTKRMIPPANMVALL